jgi:site-specific DNA recombinase
MQAGSNGIVAPIIKNPKTGKRVARPNPRELWEMVYVPALRIIDDDLWNAVKLRQQDVSFEIGRDDSSNPLSRAHRRKFLLSGLLKCGRYGGGFPIVAKDRYGCPTRRAKGTCDNDATVSRQEIEARVLKGLKKRLMAPELVREFATVRIPLDIRQIPPCAHCSAPLIARAQLAECSQTA